MVIKQTVNVFNACNAVADVATKVVGTPPTFSFVGEFAKWGTVLALIAAVAYGAFALMAEAVAYIIMMMPFFLTFLGNVLLITGQVILTFVIGYFAFLASMFAIDHFVDQHEKAKLSAPKREKPLELEKPDVVDVEIFVNEKSLV